MKTREKMLEAPWENLSWCRPFISNDGNYKLVRTEGDVSLVFPNGKEIFDNDPQYAEMMKLFAKAVNPEYDLYSGWSDEHIAMEAMGEVGCASCPFFDECECMDE